MVKISDQELLEAINECYENEGIVDGPTLNNTENEYPTQPTYSYRFDGGLKEACERAGVPYGEPKEYETREDIIEAVEKYFNKKNYLSVGCFNSSEELPSTSQLYNLFDGIDDLIESTSITDEIRRQKRKNRRRTEQRAIESKKQYSQDDTEGLKDHLWWVMKEYDNCTTQTVNNAPGPSSTIYREAFGSLPKAREKAGLQQFHTDGNGNTTDYTDRIEIDEKSFDKCKDGHVYVIKFLHNAETYYYVGSSIRIENRLNRHTTGDSEVKFHHKQDKGTINELNLEPYSLWRVDNYEQQQNESKQEFKDRLRSEEHVLSYKIASTFETHKILGGR